MQVQQLQILTNVSNEIFSRNECGKIIIFLEKKGMFWCGGDVFPQAELV